MMAREHTPSDDGHEPATPRSRTVEVHRFGPNVVLFDVHVADYREVFFVVTGDKSVAITMFDESDSTHPEAQVFVFAKPYGWSLDTTDEEALIQVWQAVGVQR
jgi:hypothetical protein